jgi:hypothetical protein
MLPGMDRHTMIVRLLEALLWFAIVVVVVLRLDRLWLRLRDVQLQVGDSFNASLRFFREGQRHRARHLVYIMADTTLILAGDQPAIDWMIITHPDNDHWNMLKVPHHGRRS